MKKLFTLILLTFCLTLYSSSSYANHPLTSTQNVISYWKLNEGSGTWADSQTTNANDLTETGTVGLAAGHSGTASVAADTATGTSYLAITDASATGLEIIDTSITIQAWVLPNVTTGLQLVAGKFSWNVSGGYALYVASGNARCYMDGDVVSVAISAGSYIHMLCTYDGVNITLYLDGVAQTPTAKTDALDSTTTDFRIGREQNNAHQCNCVIDDVAVWDDVLTTAQISLMFSSRGDDFADLTSSGEVSVSASNEIILTSLNAVTATGVGSVLTLKDIRSSFTYRTVTTGSPTGVTVLLEGSLDCTNYETLDTSTSTTGEMRHVVNKPVKCIRNNLSVLTGGSSPTVTSVLGVGID